MAGVSQGFVLRSGVLNQKVQLVHGNQREGDCQLHGAGQQPSRLIRPGLCKSTPVVPGRTATGAQNPSLT